jgi:hypothetical protein
MGNLQCYANVIWQFEQQPRAVGRPMYLYDSVWLTTLLHDRWISPTTQAEYTQYCSWKKKAEQIEEVGEGTRAYWVGEKTADRVMLFFHGT